MDCQKDSSEFDVSRIAELARLNLDDSEKLEFEQQIRKILSHMEELKTVNVDGIEPSAHAAHVLDVWRDDEPRPGFGADAALLNAPRSANQQFSVPKVVE